MTLKRIFLFLAVLGIAQGQAQEKEKICDFPDSVASYDSVRSRIDFTFQLASAISQTGCKGEDATLISSLHAMLIIDSTGKVENVEILKPIIDSQCLSVLKYKFLTMGNWTPARLGGRAVKSRYSFVVACFKWEE